MGEGSGVSAFISTVTGALSDFTSTNLGTIVVAALGITVGLALAWFAYRFITRKVAGAFKKGKV